MFPIESLLDSDDVDSQPTTYWSSRNYVHIHKITKIVRIDVGAMDVVQDFLAERVFDQLSASPKKNACNCEHKAPHGSELVISISDDKNREARNVEFFN